jgi:outer membrane protein OmpA-like peptidoglycan-associated protein
MYKLALLTFSTMMAFCLLISISANAENNPNSISQMKKFKWQEYMAYEQREPCQNYQITTFSGERCWGNPMKNANPFDLHPVLMDYTIHFDFDDANILSNENAIIARVAHDILTYQPYEVTVFGHTDTAGSDAYNLILSQKRASSVSEMLSGIGIPNRVLEEGALGESDLAVATGDGIRLRENRRVVIQFRK